MTTRAASTISPHLDAATEGSRRADRGRARDIERRAFQPAAIVERCWLGMIDEAAKILHEGVVARASCALRGR